MPRSTETRICNNMPNQMEFWPDTPYLWVPVGKEKVQLHKSRSQYLYIGHLWLSHEVVCAAKYLHECIGTPNARLHSLAGGWRRIFCKYQPAATAGSQSCRSPLRAIPQKIEWITGKRGQKILLRGLLSLPPPQNRDYCQGSGNC